MPSSGPTEITRGRPTADKSGALPRFSLLDAMVLVGAAAVSARIISKGPKMDEIAAAIPLLFDLQRGLVVAGPVFIAVQYMRGRRGRLFPGEIAWLAVALDLLPMGFESFDSLTILGGGGLWEVFYPWFVTVVHPCITASFTFPACIYHFREGRPRHWSHRLGLGTCILQCSTYALLVVQIIVLLLLER